MRYLTLCLGILTLVGCSPSEPPDPNVVQSKQIICEGPRGENTAGTATVLRNGTFITNAHVVTGCRPRIGGKFYSVPYSDEALDIAVLGEGRDFTQISCEFLPPRVMVNIKGYPKGSPRASTSQAETSEDLGDDLRWAFGFGEVGMSGAPVVRQDDPYRLHGVMRAILEDHSVIQYIAGPALCESLSNVEGAIFSVVPLREPLPEAQ